jgi:nicotinate-nucleotide--dimethylbenzimidazole phosphoribosyltransferase
VSRLSDELTRVFGDPPIAPRAVVRVQVGSGQGLAAGRAEADRLVDAGADLVVLDADATGPAPLVVLAVLLDLDPVAAVGTAPDEAWRELVLAVRSGVRTARAFLGDPEALLDDVADPALGRVVGLLERLAARRTAVLVGGGTGAAAAALLASRLAPEAAQHWLAGSVPVHGPAAQAWRSLGITPLLDLGLAEGSVDIAAAVVRAGLEQLGA